MRALALFVFFTILARTSMLDAAVCCGGHAAIPSLITGYERYRINSSYSSATVIGDAPAGGRPVFRDDRDQTSRGTVRLSGSALLGERWQLSFGLPVVFGADVGDAELIAAFDAHRRPHVLSLAPQGLVFAQLTFPTGRSVHEAEARSEAAITGSGFYRAALGSLLLTTWRRWDLHFMSKAGYGFPRTFGAGPDAIRVSPGWAGDLQVGAGYALTGKWRLGGTVTSSFQEGKATRASDRTGRARSQLVWPVGLQLSRFFDMNSTLTLSYEDETILGPVRNTTLSRSVMLLYSYRWSP